jgi:hypothetical protein
MAGEYRIWVNDNRTMFVRMWEDGSVEVATRDNSYETWGPPTVLTEEKV